MAKRLHLKQILINNWFFIGVLVAIILAGIFPRLGAQEGILRPDITVKYGAVFIIFFISGITLRSGDLFFAMSQIKLHMFIQVFSFFAMPLMMKIFTSVLRIFGINEWILRGLITVSCMPPPVSSAVILTKSVGGSEAAAIFNSALGSVLGIVITPLNLFLLLGTSTVVPLLSTIYQLTLTVLFPLVLGQVSRYGKCFRNTRLPLGIIAQFALLYIIFISFCQTILNHDFVLSAADLLTTVMLVSILQMFMLSLVFSVASRLPHIYTPHDVVTILFCATHKSLTLGIPMLRILYGGYSHLSTISLPLLVYHPTQIILGGLLVDNLKSWLKSKRSRSYFSA